MSKNRWKDIKAADVSDVSLRKYLERSSINRNN